MLNDLYKWNDKKEGVNLQILLLFVWIFLFCTDLMEPVLFGYCVDLLFHFLKDHKINHAFN